MSVVTISNSQFSDDTYDYNSRIESDRETLGNFLYVVLDVTLEVQNSDFLRGLGSMGGAAYITGDSDVNFSSCKFEDNFSIQNGGAIYTVGYKEIYI
jgi:predicted outer membrane repeat protein